MAAIDALDVSRQQLYPVGVVAGEICSYLMSCHGLGRLCTRSRRLIDGDCQAVEVLIANSGHIPLLRLMARTSQNDRNLL